MIEPSNVSAVALSWGSYRRQVRQRLGVDAHRHPHAATRDGHLRQLFARRGVDVVLDVGANRGQFARSLRTDVRFEGRIVSFEPDPSTFDALATEAGDDALWECRQVALGEAAGTAVLHRFAGNDTWNSLREPDHGNLAEAGRSLSEVGAVEVEVSTIDSLWSSLSLSSATPFLKVDAQGSDLEVLAGASEHLDHFSGFLTEISVLPFYEREPVLGDVVAWFASRGWTPSGFFPVTRDRHTLAVHTLDVTFVQTTR